MTSSGGDGGSSGAELSSVSEIRAAYDERVRLQEVERENASLRERLRVLEGSDNEVNAALDARDRSAFLSCAKMRALVV